MNPFRAVGREAMQRDISRIPFLSNYLLILTQRSVSPGSRASFSLPTSTLICLGCANPWYPPTHFQLHSDSLPGVRSVMEGMDILGVLFKAASDMANRTRQTKSSITKVLRGKLMGRAGLKSTLTARNAAAQMYLPAPTDCTRTTMAPAQTTRAASTVR